MKIKVFLLALMLLLSSASCSNNRPQSEVNNYNIIFISVDDLNDWISVLGGYPGIKTENFDRLAEQSVAFTMAFTASPLCNPSRSSVISGLLPDRTKVYDNRSKSSRIESKEIAKLEDNLVNLFKKNGYKTLGIGKTLHRGRNSILKWDKKPVETWKTRVKRLNNVPAFGDNPMYDWGIYEGNEEDLYDSKNIKEVVEILSEKHEKPFFLSFGIHNPHLPWVIPKRFFDMYPISSVSTRYYDGDLDDISSYAKSHFIGMSDSKEGFTEERKREAVHAYIAAVSFVDFLLGKMLDAYLSGPNKDNTIIVLWSDHGFHLGDKKCWQKATLWAQVTHVPLFIHAPKISKDGARCSRAVSLVDIYPTLLDLCGLKTTRKLDGHSLRPLLINPEDKWDHSAISIYKPGNYSVVKDKWHFIHYEDGSKELYDLDADPREHENLIYDKKHDGLVKELTQLISERISKFRN